MLEAEIICLGNELLMGITVNTNASFLGEQLTNLGYRVQRITTIRDEKKLASECIKEVLSRNPDVLVVSGGLGPTYDDIQMEVISLALDCKLVEYRDALQMIKEFYDTENLEMTPERKKMAKLPKGAEIFDNRVGAAPGCKIIYKKTEIFCLPGVPTEMKDIFTRHFYPHLKEKTDIEINDTKFSVIGCRESELAPFINKVKKKNQKLYIKSHPQFGKREGIIIHISGVGEEGKKQMKQAKQELLSLIEKNVKDIRIETIK